MRVMELAMRLIVTGGAGFIGSNLVDALVEMGHEVLVVDDLSTGKEENLNPRARFVRADIADPQVPLADLFAGAECVFHTAALARVPRSIEDPIGTHRVNVTGTLHVLQAAVQAGVRRVVYSSSSSVYGDQEVLPLVEDMRPDPVNPYGMQKLMGELYCRTFHRVYGLSTVCLRYFNVYGPRQVMEGAYRLVIGIFLDQKRRGQPMTVFGDGEQTRDFTHVRDVVQANILAMSSDRVGRGDAINVGTGRETSVNRIAELIGGPVVHLDPRPFEERRKRADITRARDLLGWRPTVSVEDGIRELLGN